MFHISALDSCKQQLRFSLKCGCYTFALSTDDREPGQYDIVVTYKGGREVMRIMLEEPAS